LTKLILCSCSNRFCRPSLCACHSASCVSNQSFTSPRLFASTESRNMPFDGSQVYILPSKIYSFCTDAATFPWQKHTKTGHSPKKLSSRFLFIFISPLITHPTDNSYASLTAFGNSSTFSPLSNSAAVYGRSEDCSNSSLCFFSKDSEIHGEHQHHGGVIPS